MIAALLLAFNLADWWAQASGETSSHAATSRGVQQFQKKDYGRAAQSFAKANALRPSPSSSFNLGTAQVAAGRREDGSSTLQKAMADPALRERALYNRGNSALAAKAWDYAIRDYVDALKLKPHDAAAKRNLEIALSRKQAAQQPSDQQRNSSGGGNKEQQKPSPAAGKQQEPQQARTDPNAEALLRSVQQQEQEELSRMRRPRGEKLRVGW